MTQYSRQIVRGLFTQPQVYRPVSSLKVIGALFYPDAITQLFGMDVSNVTDQEIYLDDLAEVNISEALFNELDTAKQINILTGFLMQ